MALACGSTKTLSTLGKMIQYDTRKNSKLGCGIGFEVQQPTNYIKGHGREW